MATRIGYALALCLGAFMAVVFAAAGPAMAAMPLIGGPSAASSSSPSAVLKVGQDGGLRFHHGKRVTEAYCLKRNYWWFYRPYTTAAEDYPRCEPYFHYLESAGGSGNAWVDRAMK